MNIQDIKMGLPANNKFTLITIDGNDVEVPKGSTILQAADVAEIYLPRLCSHPDIPAYDSTSLETSAEIFQGENRLSGNGPGHYKGCLLCSVEVEGAAEPVRACATPVSDGMVVTTSTERIDAIRAESMRTIYATHPHACVQCAQRQGCALEPCSTNVEKPERCCPIFHMCELRFVSEFVNIPDDTSRYHPAELPIVENEPLYLRDYNLCIGCLRCVRVCRDVRKADAIGYLLDENGRPVVGMKASDAKESGCQFCLSCVEICPTGSLRLLFEDPRIDGERVSKCISGCPSEIDIPRYLREIRRGEYARAEAVVREAAPLPGVLGEVCFHPCESECLRNDINEPISICALKRAAVENTSEFVWRNEINLNPTGKRVAIIGAGPAGLSAAWYLRLKGHDVTIFEASTKPGGWLHNGIPPYRLASGTLESDVKQITDIGVMLKSGVNVGVDISFDELKNNYDAILIAAGARRGKKLPVDGADIPGVEVGLDILDELAGSDKSCISYAGQKVVIIGGGNVAIDIARTAIRLGPDEVHLYCLEERDEMPAHDWEITDAEAEGIIMHPGWGPSLISGNGSVNRIDFKKCTSVFDSKGRFSPEFDDATTTSQDADVVLIAIGQKPDIDFMKDAVLKTSGAGTIEVDSDTGETSIEGVFAAGEVVSGPASVVDAIAQGKITAAGIDRHLGGDGKILIKLLDHTELEIALSEMENFCDASRIEMPSLPVSEATACFELAQKGYSTDDAGIEADRCLRCDLRLNMNDVTKPPEPWLEMIEESMQEVPETDGVYQLLDEEKIVYAIHGVDNLREALEEVLENTEKAKYFLFEEDKFFSKRESELIAQYLKVYGAMPPGEGEDDLDDLF